MILRKVSTNKSYIWGLIYTAFIIFVGGIVNYITWTEGPVEELKLTYLIAWISLYIPFFYYLFCDNWKIKDFGFVSNYHVATTLVVIIVFIMFRIEHISLVNWQSSIIETFARTGEELFFRGFLYTLLLKIYKSKKKPWLWAVILSSLAFALVHTQTFLPEYNSSILDVFILAMIMALLRKWTGSILPAISFHVLFNAGILGVIFGLVGYWLFVLVSYLKGELAIK